MNDRNDVALINLSMGVRPLRTALLVHVPDGLPWQGVFAAALASRSSVWGGSGDLVLPLTALDSDVAWRLLDVFDADRISVFTPSWEEVSSIDSDRYETARAARDVDLGEAAAADTLPDWQGLPYQQVELHDDLARALAHRLAPFHDDIAPVRTITGSSPVLFEETSLRVVGLPRKTLSDLRPNPESVESLYGIALLGHLSPEARRIVTGLGASITDADLSSGEAVLDLYDSGLRNSEVAYPWEMSEAGLAQYRRGFVPRRPVVVFGDEPWDFTLFYALHVMGEAAWWCPSGLLDNTGWRHHLMRQLDRAASSNRRVNVASVSRPDDAGDVTERLRASLFATRSPIELTPTTWRAVIPENPSRFYERDGYGFPQTILMQGNSTAELSTPIPRVAPGAGPSELHWVTEVRTDTWTPLRNGELAGVLLEQHLYDREQLRTTRDGLAYFCPHHTWVGDPSLEAVVARPRLHRLSLLEQLRELAWKDGGVRVDLSDKGIYASESAALFGGFAPLDEALRDPPARAIFDAFLQEDAPGLFLKSDRRRYIGLNNLRILAKDAGDPDELLASLVDKGVLSRGFPLKCARCRQVSWYSLDDIGTRFSCARCRYEQESRTDTFLTRPEPTIVYGLAEVVYQMLKNRGDIPLRAATALTAGSSRPIEYSFEIELTDQHGVKSEHDIVVADGYRLWMGEATSSDRLDASGPNQHQRLVKLKTHAELLGAYGVVLATRQTNFWTTLISQAESLPLFGGPWPRLRLLTNLS